MKLNFKIIILFTIANFTQARELIVFSYKTKTPNVEFMLESMKEEVTEKLLTVLEKDNPCEDIYKDSILHVCINENDELKIIRQNIEVLKRSISKL